MLSRYRKILPALALVLCILQIGCVAPESLALSSAALPADKPNAVFQVHEYALVEASTDNPDHTAFQERALAAVSEQRSGWFFSRAADAVQAPNQTLAPFGYHLAANPSPPFSSFALYRDNQLIQRDIARFWPVKIKNADTSPELGDFLLSFQTLTGEKLVASADGIHPWQGQEQSARGLQKALYQNQMAYAEGIGSGADSEISVIPGPQVLYDEKSAADTFGWQVVAGQPFYFYMSGDLVHVNYAGRDLAYTYDRVVHNNTGGNAIFNPGGTGPVSWFYALRDGVWYYVEMGVFD